MRYFKLLLFVGGAIRAAHGFAPAPLSTRGVSTIITSAKSPPLFNIENDDNKNALLRTTFLGNNLNSPSSVTPRRNNRFGILTTSALLMAIAAFILPTSSNAVTTIADISSIAGGATASTAAWFDSLTDSGFYQAFSLVFLSEIGDKTFFVAALLAAKLSRFISFVGSLGALAVMSVISVVIGQVFHAVPAGIANGVPLDDVAAVIAFTYFGVKVLAEAFDSEEGKSAMDEEFEEAEEEVEGNQQFSKGSNPGQVQFTFVSFICIDDIAFTSLLYGQQKQSTNCKYFCSCVRSRIRRSFLPSNYRIICCSKSSQCRSWSYRSSRNCHWDSSDWWCIYI